MSQQVKIDTARIVARKAEARGSRSEDKQPSNPELFAARSRIRPRNRPEIGTLFFSPLRVERTRGSSVARRLFNYKTLGVQRSRRPHYETSPDARFSLPAVSFLFRCSSSGRARSQSILPSALRRGNYLENLIANFHDLPVYYRRHRFQRLFPIRVDPARP